MPCQLSQWRRWAGLEASCCQEQDAVDGPVGALHFRLAKADLSEATIRRKMFWDSFGNYYYVKNFHYLFPFIRLYKTIHYSYFAGHSIKLLILIYTLLFDWVFALPTDLMNTW